MEISTYRNLSERNYKTTIILTDVDMVLSKVPKAIKEWYEKCDHKASDELFYLSEIVKGLE